MQCNILKTARNVVLAAALLFLLPCKVFAWGREGHHIVAEVAMHYLPDAVRKKVLSALAGTTPEDAATWMDDMRASPRYDYMKTWHYIDIPKGESYAPKQYDNLITALNHAFNDIKESRVEGETWKDDLMILFHLVGDLHQPLHDGYPEDKGGNSIQLNYDGSSTNIHHIWDDDIIRSQRITAKDCLLPGGMLPKTQIASIGSGTFVDWMQESRALLPGVYAFSGHTIDEGYMRKNKVVVETQLLKAGIRLAHVLEILFGSGTGTVATSSESVSLGVGSIPKSQANASMRFAGSLSPEQAAQHIGETATVCGKVYGGKYLKSSSVTFINMGAAYPASPFSIVIFGKDRDKFNAPPEVVYDGTTICVTGLIKEFKGKAEIIVSKEDQIQIQ